MTHHPHGSWSRVHAWSCLVLVLGASVMLLAWTDVSICAACRPSSNSSNSNSNNSSCNSTESVLEVPLFSNVTEHGGLLTASSPPAAVGGAAAAAAASVQGTDNLLGAVDMADVIGTAGAADSASNHTLCTRSNISSGSSTNGSDNRASDLPAASNSIVPQSAKPSVQQIAGSAHQSSSKDSSRSSRSVAAGACTCTRADPAVLRKYCSVKDRHWPHVNEELVTQCFDMLVNRTSEYLQQLQHNPGQNISCTKPLLVHTYWAGSMTWKLKAVIQSFLFTHYADDTSCRPKPVLNVWLQNVNPTRDLLERWAKEWQAPYLVCSDQLQFRQFTADGWMGWLPASMLASLGKAASNITALRAAVQAGAATGSHVSYSDAVRFLVLHRFGGIYIDADVLLLRSLEPVSHFDFLYEWSFVKQGLNSAVFGARKQSPFTTAVIQKALQASAHFNATRGVTAFDMRAFTSIFHPLRVVQRVPPAIAAQVEVLPSIPFDPVWLTVDTPTGKTNNLTRIHRVRAWKDVFTKPPPHLLPPQDPVKLFHGAFTHHWHNTWGAPFEETSLVGQLVKMYEDFLQGKRPNLYGVMAAPCTPDVQALLPNPVPS